MGTGQQSQYALNKRRPAKKQITLIKGLWNDWCVIQTPKVCPGQTIPWNNQYHGTNGYGQKDVTENLASHTWCRPCWYQVAMVCHSYLFMKSCKVEFCDSSTVILMILTVSLQSKCRCNKTWAPNMHFSVHQSTIYKILTNQTMCLFPPHVHPHVHPHVVTDLLILG